MRAHHYGLTVSDLDRATDFYVDVLGLDVAREFAVGGEAFAEAVDVAGASAEFVHLDAGGALIELVDYDPAGEDRAGGDVNDAGASHLGLAVDDVDAVYHGLPDDVETHSSPRTTESGTRICFLRDPEGNLVELVEA